MFRWYLCLSCNAFVSRKADSTDVRKARDELTTQLTDVSSKTVEMEDRIDDLIRSATPLQTSTTHPASTLLASYAAAPTPAEPVSTTDLLSMYATSPDPAGSEARTTDPETDGPDPGRANQDDGAGALPSDGDGDGDPVGALPVTTEQEMPQIRVQSDSEEPAEYDDEETVPRALSAKDKFQPRLDESLTDDSDHSGSESDYDSDRSTDSGSEASDDSAEDSPRKTRSSDGEETDMTVVDNPDATGANGSGGATGGHDRDDDDDDATNTDRDASATDTELQSRGMIGK